jgi:hypothetical protein
LNVLANFPKESLDQYRAWLATVTAGIPFFSESRAGEEIKPHRGFEILTVPRAFQFNQNDEVTHRLSDLALINLRKLRGLAKGKTIDEWDWYIFDLSVWQGVLRAIVVLGDRLRSIKIEGAAQLSTIPLSILSSNRLQRLPFRAVVHEGRVRGRPKLTIGFEMHEAIDVLKDLEVHRIRECGLCKTLFWAGRTKVACSARCGVVLRKRTWRRKHAKLINEDGVRQVT